MQQQPSNPNKFLSISVFCNWGKCQAETTEMITVRETLFQHAWPIIVVKISGRSNVLLGLLQYIQTHGNPHGLLMSV